MCLIVFAYHHHPEYPLVLCANRDEFYDRPTRSLHFWKDHPQVAGGRDLKKMGTWMGITRQGRFAAITNYREAGTQRSDAPSRGNLVTDYLTDHTSPRIYLNGLHGKSHQYNGFNLIIGDMEGLWYYTNRNGSGPVRLDPGIYGLSNRYLNTDWPKVRLVRSGLTALLKEGDKAIDRDNLLKLLQNQETAPDGQLPDTGVGVAWERMLAPVFITSPTYGTRCSSVLTIDCNGEVNFSETTWHPVKSRPTVIQKERVRFRIEN